MESSVERKDDGPSSSPASAAAGNSPPAARDGHRGSVGSGQVPWLLVVRLGFVSVVLVIAVTLIALGYTAAASVGLVLGAGLAAAEIIKRLS